MSSRIIRLKCRWKETEIRTVAVSSDNCDFLAVKRRLNNDYGFPVSLKCKLFILSLDLFQTYIQDLLCMSLKYVVH